MDNIEALKSILFDTADAIREKTGRSALIDFPDFPDEVRSIETDGGGDVPNPDDTLLLVDWDGTLLYSYTYEDAQQISEFPDAPVHDGLTFQSWNWSEVVAKTWLQNHRGAQLKVGATYTPTDGQDQNYWRSPRLTEPNQIYMQHRATTSLNDDAFRNFLTLSNISLPNGISEVGTSSFRFCYSLSAVILPRGVTKILDTAFYYNHSLSVIVIPNSLIEIGASAFSNDYSLRIVTLPDSVITLSNNAFYYCYALSDIILSNSLEMIGGYAFAWCQSLPKIDIPASVTLIGSYAFQQCTSLVDVVLRGMPTLGGSVVFGNNPSNQRFYVHRADLSWFETATNWSAVYAEDKIVAAADYIDYLQSIGIDTTDFEGE